MAFSLALTIILMLVPDPEKHPKYVTIAQEWPLTWNLWYPPLAYFEEHNIWDPDVNPYEADRLFNVQKSQRQVASRTGLRTDLRRYRKGRRKPFVVSLSNHEQRLNPSTGSGLNGCAPRRPLRQGQLTARETIRSLGEYRNLLVGPADDGLGVHVHPLLKDSGVHPTVVVGVLHVLALDQL